MKMADVTELRMNVSALSRVDPYAKDIIETATHVALYTFNADDNEWEKTDVEGALFVYSRNGEPFHSILIMNRLNTNNLVEPVTKGLDLQLQEPFLLYRNTSCRIFGIWFYDKDECIRIASVLDKLVKESEMSKKVADRVAVKNKRGGSGDNVDICTMLSKAQENYNSNRNSALSRHAASEESKPDMPQGVVDFFAKASSGASHFQTDKVTQPPGLFESAIFVGHSQQRTPGVELVNDTSDSQLKPLLQRLMSNPAHTVEHIEKQQRSVTPQSETVSAKRNKGKPQYNKDNKHFNPVTFKPRPVPSGGTTETNKPRQANIFVAKSNPEGTTGMVENGMSFLRIASPTASQQIAPFIGPGLQTAPDSSATVDTGTPDQRSLSAPLCSSMETPQKPALMPPTMFTSSSGKETSSKLEISNVASPLVHNSMLSSFKPELSSGSLASASTAIVMQEEILTVKPEPLTRNQLLQAMSYLLKHDPEFINKLHEAYVKSFTEMVM